MCTGKGLVLLLINHLHGGQQVKEATGMYNVCVIGVNTYKRKLIDWVHCICANYKKILWAWFVYYCVCFFPGNYHKKMMLLHFVEMEYFLE